VGEKRKGGELSPGAKKAKHKGRPLSPEKPRRSGKKGKGRQERGRREGEDLCNFSLEESNENLRIARDQKRDVASKSFPHLVRTSEGGGRATLQPHDKK